MKKTTIVLVSILTALCASGCGGHRSRPSGGNPAAAPSDGSLPRMYQSIYQKAAKDATQGCAYGRTFATPIGRQLVDQGQFSAAQKSIEPLLAANHLFSTNQGQSLKRDRLAKQRQIEQLDSRRNSGARIEELEAEIAATDTLLQPMPIAPALKEHEALTRAWVDTAIARLAPLDNSDATFSALAEFDGGSLDSYRRMCADWYPRYLMDKTTRPDTHEKDDIVRLRTAISDKLYAILQSGRSSIPERIRGIKRYADTLQVGTAFLNGSKAAADALEKLGLLSEYRRQSETAKSNERELAATRRATQAALHAKAVAEIKAGKDGWVANNDYGADTLAIGKSERRDGVLFQSDLLCIPKDRREIIYFAARVQDQGDSARWKHNEGYGLPIAYRTPEGGGTLTAMIKRRGRINGQDLIINHFYLAFMDPSLADANSAEKIGGVGDTLTGALNALIEPLLRMRSLAGLALGAETLDAAAIKGKASFTVEAPYLANGQAARTWRSPDLGPASGAYARIKAACYPSTEAAD